MNAEGITLNGFRYNFKVMDGDVLVAEREQCNLIPQVGLTFLQRAPFGDTPSISAFYMGLFSNNYIPVNATTAVEIPTTAGEFLGYTAATRPLWDKTYNGTDTYDNDAAPASFVFTGDKLIYGAFLVSSSVKGSSSGTLMSMARFDTPLDVPNGLSLLVSAGLVYIPTA